MKSQKENKSKKLSCIYKSNIHLWMSISCVASLLFFILSIIAISKPQGYFFDKISQNNIREFISNVLLILSSTVSKGTQIVLSMLPLIGSGIMILLNGKKLVIILQIKTLLRYHRIKFSAIQSFLSLLLGIYSMSIGRITSSVLSFISFGIFFLYILCYLIRFYNDESYYRSEICACLLQLYDKSQNKIQTWMRKKFNFKNKFKEYISKYIFPDIPTEHNDMLKDISIVEYLILHMNFKQKQKYYNSLEKFFCEVLVTIVSQMRRTYSDNSTAFLLSFSKQLNNIRLNNSNYDFLLHHFISILFTEYLIETTYTTHGLDNSIENDFVKWFDENGEDFYHTYGNPSNIEIKYQPNLIYIVEAMYSWYICELDDRFVININFYSLKELAYLTCNENIEFQNICNDLKQDKNNDKYYFKILSCFYKIKNYKKELWYGA